MRVLEDFFITERIIAFERYNFICRQQRKNESLEQFQAYQVELASRVVSGDRDEERVRDRITAHLYQEETPEELLAET